MEKKLSTSYKKSDLDKFEKIITNKKPLTRKTRKVKKVKKE